MSKRRSIVAFEKWLASEVETVKTELYGLSLAAGELERKRAEQEVRLRTLSDVQAKLAEMPAGELAEAQWHGVAVP